MISEPSPEAIQAMMRLDARKLLNDTLQIRVFQSDDGFCYAYLENGQVQGPRERLGPWR